MKKFSQNEVEAQAVSKLQQVHFEIESDIESSREDVSHCTKYWNCNRCMIRLDCSQTIKT